MPHATKKPSTRSPVQAPAGRPPSARMSPAKSTGAHQAAKSTGAHQAAKSTGAHKAAAKATGAQPAAKSTGAHPKIPGMKVSGRLPVPEGAKLELVDPQATRARPKGSGAVAASHSLPKKRSSATHAAVQPLTASGKQRREKGPPPRKAGAGKFPVELLVGIPIVLVLVLAAFISFSGKTPPPTTHTTTPAATAAPAPVAAPAARPAAPQETAAEDGAAPEAPATRTRGGDAEPTAEEEAEFEKIARQREKELAEEEAKWMAEREAKAGAAPAPEPSAEPGSNE